MDAIILTILAMSCLSLYFITLNSIHLNILRIYACIHVATYISVFTYLAYTALYVEKSSIHAIAFDLTLTNFPLYFLASLCAIGSYIILDFLAQKHDIPKITALSQMSLIYSTIGYYFLGDIMTPISFMCLVIILCGSIISGFTKIPKKHPLDAFKIYFNIHLIKWSIFNAFLISIPEIITYLCTAHHDETTRNILKLMTKHAHGIPFVPVTPIFTNIGVQLCNIILLFGWLIYQEGSLKPTIQTIKKYKTITFVLALFHVIYIFGYFFAFAEIENKNIISGIVQLYLPISIYCSTIIYHQKWHKYEVVGMAIIAIGSILSTVTAA